MKVETLGQETLINCAKTAMSSKIVGAESAFFSQLVVDAVKAVKTEPKGMLDTQHQIVIVSASKGQPGSARHACYLSLHPRML